MVVARPISSVSNRKNSSSGPMLKVSKPMSSARRSTRRSTPRGSPTKGVPSGLYTSQMSRATLPWEGRQGKMVKLFKSGYRHWSDS